MANTQDNFNSFVAAESTLSSASPTTINGRSIYRFAPPYNPTRVPLHIRTGAQTFNQTPVERKRYDQIEFHGRGSLYVRVYVDGIWICDGAVTMTETPAKDRRIGIPTGTRGYVIDLEVCGDADVRAVEFTYRPMVATS